MDVYLVHHPNSSSGADASQRPKHVVHRTNQQHLQQQQQKQQEQQLERQQHQQHQQHQHQQHQQQHQQHQQCQGMGRQQQRQQRDQENLGSGHLHSGLGSGPLNSGQAPILLPCQDVHRSSLQVLPEMCFKQEPMGGLPMGPRQDMMAGACSLSRADRQSVADGLVLHERGL